MTKSQFITNLNKQLIVMEDAKTNLKKYQKMIDKIECLKNDTYKTIEVKAIGSLFMLDASSLIIKIQRTEYSNIRYYKLTNVAICESDAYEYNAISSDNILDGDIEEILDSVDFYTTEIKNKMDVIINDYTSLVIKETIKQIDRLDEDDLEYELVKHSSIINIAKHYAI